MRLLQLNQRGELSLTKDLLSAIPPYAILSHTWGDDDDEVTFDDLDKGLGQSKIGYTKLQFCGNQARRDKIDYFWADTCCINKANHAELSEAITSMFRWYHGAVKCYVYLSDVPNYMRDDNGGLEQAWQSAFRNSRWFTRGWTLQELLAPKDVEFFSREEKLLGNKETLEGLIHEITDIPATALQGALLSEFLVDERLGWAAKRDTKRKEDKAYCLLGIFNVFIPLIYGEEENAFIRLKEEIDKRSGKKVTTSPSPSSTVPFRCDADFVDRQASQDGKTLLELIKQQCAPSFFYTSDYKSNKDINPERVPGTCTWFLNHPTFLKWRESNNNDLLWLSADPGCGKSVLSRALIDENLLGTKYATVCYFFFKDNDEQDNTVTALCALLHQLFSAHDSLLQKHVASAMKKYGQALKSTFEELWRIFTDAATDPSAGNVICVLDALDECRQSDRDKLISYLEDFYRRSSKQPTQGSKLKFLVTSRPYNDIERRFGTLARLIPTIRLAGEDESEQISREIGIVIDSELEKIAEELDLDEDVQSSLHKRLSKVSNRTYLWLYLTLDEVRQASGSTKRKLIQVIDTLPNKVMEAYENILKRCKQDEAIRALYIIVAAQRPLTLTEIDVALEIQVDMDSPSISYMDLDREGKEKRKKWLRKSCGLLVSIVDARVFLIHQTAREFLLRKHSESSVSQGWRQSIDLQRAHQVLAKICITHLLFQEFKDYDIPAAFDRNNFRLSEHAAVRQYAEKYAFLDYSANHWIVHMQEAHIDNDTWISKAAKLCDIGDGSSCAWFAIYSSSPYMRHARSTQSALYWAAVFGLIYAAEYLLELISNERQTDIIDALQVAAANRNHGRGLVALLLTRMNELSITEEVVEAAAGNDSSGKDIMALLLEQRAEEVQITEAVVKAAAGNESGGKEIIALLLEQRAEEVQITEAVIEAAAEKWSSGKEIMALLLEQRADKVQITEAAVKAAAGNRSRGKEIIALLLEQRAHEVEASVMTWDSFERLTPSLSRFYGAGIWWYLRFRDLKTRSSGFAKRR